MKTPPFLVGAALLFWGWQTGFLWAGAVMATVIEGARFVKARWEFGDDDLSRIWTFCTVLFLAAILYAFTANDGVSNFGGFFQNPTLSSQREAGETSARTAASLIRWLPLLLFPFVAAQTYNTRDRVPLAAISLLMRRRLRKAKERGEKAAALRAINVSYPYLIVCLGASCAHTLHEQTFFPGFAVLVMWALWPHRPRRFGFVTFAVMLFVVAGLGYAGQLGVARLQALLNNYQPQWFSRLNHGGFDPERSRTALGEIGRLKQSGRIVIRLRTADEQAPPQYLREASYREYREQVWFAGAGRDDFLYEAPETNETSWVFLPEKTATNRAVNITFSLPGQRALLPLPPGVARVDHLPDYVVLNRNSLGAVMAEGAGLLMFDAAYGPGATIDSPPDDDADRAVPEQEREVLRRIAAGLEIDGSSTRAKMRAVAQFLGDGFSYSLWQRPPQLTSTDETPLSRFLLETRSGHCEYFATAAVLLLRELGVPARYAVGHVVHEGSDGKYVVRQRDAHSWCLAWDEDRGTWLDFETTPGSSIEEERKRASMFEWLGDAWSRVKFEVARVRWGQSNLRQYILILLVPVLLVLLYQIIFRSRKKRRDRLGTDRPAASWPGMDSEFYALERKLVELGFERLPGEPVAVWLNGVLQGGALEPLHGSVSEVLRLHYRHRFDPNGLGEGERNRLRKKVEHCLSALHLPKGKGV